MGLGLGGVEEEEDGDEVVEEVDWWLGPDKKVDKEPIVEEVGKVGAEEWSVECVCGSGVDEVDWEVELEEYFHTLIL